MKLMKDFKQANTLLSETCSAVIKLAEEREGLPPALRTVVKEYQQVLATGGTRRLAHTNLSIKSDRNKFLKLGGGNDF